MRFAYQSYCGLSFGTGHSASGIKCTQTILATILRGPRSGGQRQTVAIARSLLLDPHIVMLDEPTAALGVAQTAEVLNLIERLRDRGHGVIMISHNMEDVRAVADRIVVLRLGRNNGIFTPRLVERRAGRSDHRGDRQRRFATSRPRGAEDAQEARP